MTLESRGFARSRDKSKAYLNYHNVYGHQTWQGVDLKWETPTHESNDS